MDKTILVCRTALIAALYTVLTVAIAPLSYGPVQFRFSECLTVLPLFFPESVIGLTVGCFFSNLFGNGPLDLIFGTLATFSASLLGFLISKKCKNFAVKLFWVEFFAIVINAVIVPFTFLAFTELKEAYFINMLTVGLGQLVVISTLGTLLALSIKKYYKR